MHYWKYQMNCFMVVIISWGLSERWVHSWKYHRNCFRNSVATSLPLVFTDILSSLISLSISCGEERIWKAINLNITRKHIWYNIHVCMCELYNKSKTASKKITKTERKGIFIVWPISWDKQSNGSNTWNHNSQ